MKTQLLEDIGQSATLSLVPSKIPVDKSAENKVVEFPAVQAWEPARSRAGSGVWRQKPVAEPVVLAQQAEQPPTPLELDSVFEEIAALEARYVRPALDEAPAAEALSPTPVSFAAEPRHDISISPAVLPVAAEQQDLVGEPRDPLFDFTRPPSSQSIPDLNPFTIPAGPSPSRQRYAVWGACILAGAMLIQGGRWLYAEQDTVGTRAVATAESREEPHVDKAVKRRAIAAKEFTLGPGGEVSVTPQAPPLVLLKPEPTVAAKAEQNPPKPVERAVLQEPRKQAAVENNRANLKDKRDPAYALATAASAERKPARESATAATLKACREHGYHAEQCVKRACSVTKYGFVCRG